MALLLAEAATAAAKAAESASLTNRAIGISARPEQQQQTLPAPRCLRARPSTFRSRKEPPPSPANMVVAKFARRIGLREGTGNATMAKRLPTIYEPWERLNRGNALCLSLLREKRTDCGPSPLASAMHPRAPAADADLQPAPRPAEMLMRRKWTLIAEGPVAALWGRRRRRGGGRARTPPPILVVLPGRSSWSVGRFALGLRRRRGALVRAPDAGPGGRLLNCVLEAGLLAV